jgi:Gram-negative bacterial TonB protein C-terminal
VLAKHCGIVFMILFSVVTNLLAFDLKPVEKQAMMEFYGKNLLLSHPYVNNKLRFSASGALVGNSEEGTWTMNGIAHVEKIEVKPNLIRVSAKREIIVLRTENGKLGLQPIYLTKHLEVELEAANTIATLDDVRQTLGRVFHEENLGRKINEYWRAVVRITGVNPKSGQLTMEGGLDGVYGYLEGDHPVYLPTSQIVPPQRTHKEDAVYTRTAAVKRTQGKVFIMVVVNEKGYPAIIHLLKDLGDDLDIQTLAATSQWRFRSATKDGQPVAAVTRVNWEAVTY